ncbi:MAG: hypothetical protein ACPGVT_14340, partial [Maricaulaceae bacterium]
VSPVGLGNYRNADHYKKQPRKEKNKFEMLLERTSKPQPELDVPAESLRRFLQPISNDNSEKNVIKNVYTTFNMSGDPVSKRNLNVIENKVIDAADHIGVEA